MQTMVEFLKQEYIKRGDCLPSGVFEQAKEMEKQQIINAHLIGLITSLEMEATKQATEYFNENYGSKGSDDINSLTSNYVDYQNPSNLSDKFKQFSLYEHKETIATSDTPTSSQTEISDEEIVKAFTIETPRQITIYHGEIAGAKWYREQLKKKQ